MLYYFNPRSPHGERHFDAGQSWLYCYFNPRSPHGERRDPLPSENRTITISTHAPRTGSDANNFLQQTLQSISTHAPRTGSDRKTYNCDYSCSISTHAPRTGSDTATMYNFDPSIFISTHAPRTGSDYVDVIYTYTADQFQPTLPARGATQMQRASITIFSDFNPRSPCGERGLFQPTLPARGATCVSSFPIYKR